MKAWGERERTRGRAILTDRERCGDHLVVHELPPLHDEQGEVGGADDVLVHRPTDQSGAGQRQVVAQHTEAAWCL